MGSQIGSWAAVGALAALILTLIGVGKQIGKFSAVVEGLRDQIHLMASKEYVDRIVAETQALMYRDFVRHTKER